MNDSQGEADMEADIQAREVIFQHACTSQTCPKCLGFVVGPQWEPTTQGLVYTGHCVNCGWRGNSNRLVVDYSMPEEQLPDHVQTMKRLTRQREIVRMPRLDLSRYEFGGV